MRLGQQELEALLRDGHETRAFECKSPGDLSETEYVVKVARAAMAMGNLRDGGNVCLGIADNTIGDMLPSLSDTQVTAWSNYDNVADQLAKYVDPPLSFRPRVMDLPNGKRIVLIEVDEFTDVPHLCKRDWGSTLHAGAMYVRSRSKPESVNVRTVTDMRDVLELATNKGVREFVRHMSDAGVFPSAAPSSPSSKDQFDAEASTVWAQPSTVVDTIKSVGHIDVAVHPEPYGERMDTVGMREFVTTRAVSMRGWPVPYVDVNDRDFPFMLAGDWVGQDEHSNVVPHVEAWRLTSSGQFLQRRVLPSDFDRSHALLAEQPADGGVVGVFDVSLYLVEVVELGVRLAEVTGCEAVTFDVALRNVAGRALAYDYFDYGHAWSQQLTANDLTASMTVDAARLLQAAREVARELAQKLLRQFAVTVADQTLDQKSEEIFGRRAPTETD